jgi:hypothetical protein
MSPTTCRVVFPFALAALLAFCLSIRAEEAAPPAGQDAASKASIDDRVANLEAQIANLKPEVQRASGPSVLAMFLCAAFCALWAQNTNRNPWLWFFVGFIFSFITVFVLLWENSKDVKGRRPAPATEKAEFDEPACV